MSKRIRMLLISCAACIVCVGLMIFVLTREPQQEIRFTPPPFDAQAVVGVPELTAENGYRSIDATEYLFALCGDLVLVDGRADLWFTNDAQNSAWLRVVLRDAADNVLGETGLIRPGEYVQGVQLDVVPEETTEVKLVVMGYEPETYYSVGNVTLYTALTVPPTAAE